jgi:uncharacterized protein (DUF305 family)
VHGFATVCNFAPNFTTRSRSAHLSTFVNLQPCERTHMYPELGLETCADLALVGPTGDVDRDFVAAMMPHHQGAIEIARAELKRPQ